MKSAPREVIGLLARHEEAAVAAPVLLKSKALSDSVNTEKFLICKIRNGRKRFSFLFLQVVDDDALAQRPIAGAQ